MLDADWSYQCQESGIMSIVFVTCNFITPLRAHQQLFIHNNIDGDDGVFGGVKSGCLFSILLFWPTQMIDGDLSLQKYHFVRKQL